MIPPRPVATQFTVCALPGNPELADRFSVVLEARPDNMWVARRGNQRGQYLDVNGEWARGPEFSDRWKANFWHPYPRAVALAQEAVAALTFRGLTAAEIIAEEGAAIDPDKPCEHNDFVSYVAINRLTRSDDDPAVIAYAADITVHCLCGEPFRFTGVPAGMSPARPMVSVDETELHAPIRPASADPDFGLGIPGFAIRVYGGDA